MYIQYKPYTKMLKLHTMHATYHATNYTLPTTHNGFNITDHKCITKYTYKKIDIHITIHTTTNLNASQYNY